MLAGDIELPLQVVLFSSFFCLVLGGDDCMMMRPFAVMHIPYPEPETSLVLLFPVAVQMGQTLKDTFPVGVKERHEALIMVPQRAALDQIII